MTGKRRYFLKKRIHTLLALKVDKSVSFKDDPELEEALKRGDRVELGAIVKCRAADGDSLRHNGVWFDWRLWSLPKK